MSNLYLSSRALEDLKKELIERKTITRRKIAEKISAAIALGDLSENFEYTEAKEDQGTNEVRIIQIEDMIKEGIVVEQETGEQVIQIGSRFTARTANGAEKRFEIVGTLEADPLNGKMSHESPLGRACIGKRVGETAEVVTPSGAVVYTVLAIE